MFCLELVSKLEMDNWIGLNNVNTNLHIRLECESIVFSENGFSHQTIMAFNILHVNRHLQQPSYNIYYV